MTTASLLYGWVVDSVGKASVEFKSNMAANCKTVKSTATIGFEANIFFRALHSEPLLINL